MTRYQEVKYNDIARAAYAMDTTGTVTLLNGIAQGTDNNNRIGRRMNFTAVQVKGMIQPVDNTSLPCLARLIIVWDNDPAIGTPTITDLLTTSTSSAFNNLNNTGRFKILAEELHAVGGLTATLTGSPTVATINRYVKLPSSLTINNGTGATVASIQQGALWAFTIGDQASGAGAQFTGEFRCRYTDA